MQQTIKRLKLEGFLIEVHVVPTSARQGPQRHSRAVTKKLQIVVNECVLPLLTSKTDQE